MDKTKPKTGTHSKQNALIFIQILTSNLTFSLKSFRFIAKSIYQNLSWFRIPIAKLRLFDYQDPHKNYVKQIEASTRMCDNIFIAAKARARAASTKLDIVKLEGSK